MSTPRITSIASIFLVVSLVLAACSQGDQATDGATNELSRGLTGESGADAPETTVARDAIGEEAMADDAGADDESGDLDAQSTPIAPTQSQVATGRDIIYTAQVSIEVEDVASAAREAGQIIQSLGGLLFGQETTGGAEPRTTLVFRVLPEDFGEALDRLGSLGIVEDQRISADDVTERVVDLESRINTAEVSVERLRDLLASATDIEDIAALENQLLQRETNLETLRGQLRTIQDQVDLATITVTISEIRIQPEISVAVTSYPGTEDAGRSCPGDPDVEIEARSSTTVCFEIVNVGDSPLTELTLVDPVLGVTLDDLTLVSGMDGEALEPGTSLMYSTTHEVDETLRLRTRVGAVPLDDAGEPLESRTVADTAIATIVAVDPGGVPGFGDGLSASWEFLQLLGGVVVLAIGAIIPFLWIVPVAWLISRLARRRSTEVTATSDIEEDELSPETAGV